MAALPAVGAASCEETTAAVRRVLGNEPAGGPFEDLVARLVALSTSVLGRECAA